MVLANIIKLRLLISIRIHLVVNISKIVKYIELVKRQRVEELKPVEINEKRVESVKISY